MDLVTKAVGETVRRMISVGDPEDEIVGDTVTVEDVVIVGIRVATASGEAEMGAGVGVLVGVSVLAASSYIRMSVRLAIPSYTLV